MKLMRHILLLFQSLLVVPAITIPYHQKDRDWSDCSAPCDGGERYEYVRKKWLIPCNAFPCDFSLQEGCACGASNVLFIVDRSFSIKEKNYWVIKQFMMDVINAYDMVAGNAVKEKVRVAVITFDQLSSVEFDFNDGYSLANKEALLDVIWEMKYEPLDKGTNTPMGMHLGADMYEQQTNNNTSQLTVIITDGRATKRGKLPKAIERLHANYRSVIVVGIGDIEWEELVKIVNGEAGNVLTVDDFDALAEILSDVVMATCCRSNTKTCFETKSECSTTCGPGEITVADTCEIRNSGQLLNTQSYEHFVPCCHQACAITYCGLHPCGPGICTEVTDGYTCTFDYEEIGCPSDGNNIDIL